MLKNFIKIIFSIIVLVILVFIIFSLSKQPSNDKNWTDDTKILPVFSINGSIVNIKNLRDWRYDFGSVTSKNYYEDIYDADKIEKTYLVFNPFGKWEGVGHFFFVFDFSDGKSVAVSVEARREEGEKYSATNGLFNNYEIWYAFGGPADFFTRRVVYLDEDLYMYPLLIDKKYSKDLFLDLSKSANSLETNPTFYNTITSNCTNELANSANRVKLNSVPWHISRIFTGYADNQLYDLGYIPNDKSFDEVYNDARIDNIIYDFDLKNTNYDKDYFWRHTLQ